MIQRNLSLDEILGIYGIPKDIRSYFKSRKHLPFLQKVSLKVSVFVGLTLVKWWLSNEKPGQIFVIDRQNNSSRNIEIDESDNASSSNAYGKQKESKDVITAKNDNEEVRLELWGIPAVEDCSEDMGKCTWLIS